MGILDIRSALPNSTKCDTWNDVRASHTSTNAVQLKLDFIYGPAILICTGLILAMVTFCIEKTLKCLYIDGGEDREAGARAEGARRTRTMAWILQPPR